VLCWLHEARYNFDFGGGDVIFGGWGGGPDADAPTDTYSQRRLRRFWGFCYCARNFLRPGRYHARAGAGICVAVIVPGYGGHFMVQAMMLLLVVWLVAMIPLMFAAGFAAILRRL